MERRDLVVVVVGDDERLRREGLGDLADVLGRRSPRAQPRQVVAPSAPTAATMTGSPPSAARL
jgi:hypothetical protein